MRHYPVRQVLSVFLLSGLASCGPSEGSSSSLRSATEAESATQSETTSSLLEAAATDWAPGVAYAVGTMVRFNSVVYQCIQAHTSQVGWEPPNTPALWQRPTPSGILPWQSQTIYPLEAGVTFGGSVYRCIQAHNSQSDWTPPATPALWKLTADVLIPPGVSGTLSFVY